jgi:hypothetical protein
MRIVTTNTGSVIFDQEFRNEVVRIMSSLETTIDNDMNIFFLKNCTVPRLVTDYMTTGIKRVIKSYKADYCVLKPIKINEFPIYYNEASNCVTEDENDEVFYNSNFNNPEEIDSLNQILDFILIGQKVKYIDQINLNNSLNNGFIIDNDNYTTLKELIDSPNTDNQTLAEAMVKASPVKDNVEWLLYLYFQQPAKLKDSIVLSIINDVTKVSFGVVTMSFSQVLNHVTNPIIRKKFHQKAKNVFYTGLDNYLAAQGLDKNYQIVDFNLKEK